MQVSSETATAILSDLIFPEKTSVTCAGRYLTEHDNRHFTSDCPVASVQPATRPVKLEAGEAIASLIAFSSTVDVAVLVTLHVPERLSICGNCDYACTQSYETLLSLPVVLVPKSNLTLRRALDINAADLTGYDVRFAPPRSYGFVLGQLVVNSIPKYTALSSSFRLFTPYSDRFHPVFARLPKRSR